MTRRARLGAAARIAVGGVLLVGVLFLAVFPTRTFLDQRESIATGEERLSTLRDENERLRERIQALRTPEEIEKIAREQYNLARPGEELFVVIPSEMEAVRRHGVTAQVVETIRQGWGIPPAPPPGS